MEKYAIYIDLDGVMADYEGGFRRDHPDINIEGTNRSSHLLPGSGSAVKRESYERVQGTTFYADLPLMPGAVELYAFCIEADPIILTAAPKFGATEEDFWASPYWTGAAFHKRWWVEHVLLPAVDLHVNPQIRISPKSSLHRIRIPDNRFVCTTSSRKQQFMHRKHSEHQVLVDDRIDNIEAWRNAGGIGVLHTSAEDSIAQLKEIVGN